MQNIIKIKTDEDMKDLLKCFEGKNLNFLIGSGASMPYLKTLELESKDKFTFEDVFDYSVKNNSKNSRDFFSAFFIGQSLINGTYENIKTSPDAKDVLEEYKSFVNNIYIILNGNSVQKPKRANIFTTNYDMFFETTFDLLSSENVNINFNDGSVGFINKIISTERFHYRISNVGVDNKFEYELPMINLIKLHGSLNWKVEKSANHEENKIYIDNCFFQNKISNEKKALPSKISCSEYVKDDGSSNELRVKNLVEYFNALPNKFDNYYDYLNEIAIVQPTKDKFRETVFKEHYYQSLRILTQELERNQTVLIVFGFSFEDEHILSILKRSLNNPGLLVYIFAYDKTQLSKFTEKFKNFNNIRFIINSILVNESNRAFIDKFKNKKCDFWFVNKCLGAQDYE